MFVDGDRHHLGPRDLQSVQHRRERGVLHEHASAERDQQVDQPVDRVQSPIDHRERLGLERPALSNRALQLGEHGVIQVVRGEVLQRHVGDRRGEVREQIRVRRSGGQVQGEGTPGDLPVPGRRLVGEGSFIVARIMFPVQP